MKIKELIAELQKWNEECEIKMFIVEENTVYEIATVEDDPDIDTQIVYLSSELY